MEENISRNYNDVNIKCMKKVYIPNVVLLKEDVRNKYESEAPESEAPESEAPESEEPESEEPENKKLEEEKYDMVGRRLCIVWLLVTFGILFGILSLFFSTTLICYCVICSLGLLLRCL